jgi:hypothetical protein
MVKLKEIPKEVLDQIEAFIKANWGKMPVSSQFANKTIQGEIERRWGYRLSPAQIRRLYEGRYKLSNVEIPLEHAMKLEEEFGSVAKGVRVAVARLIDTIPRVPEPYDRAYKVLRGREFTIDELIAELKALGYERPQEVLAVLRREGLLGWEGNKVKIYKERRLEGFGLW